MKKLNKVYLKLIEQMVKKSLNSKGLVDERKVRQFVNIVKEYRGRVALVLLFEYYRRIKRELEKEVLVIESPIKLSNDLINLSKKMIVKDYPVSAVQTQINPSLLGGIRLKIGDLVIDASLAGKVSQLRKELTGAV